MNVRVGTWVTGPSPRPEDARLIEWELVLPAADDIEAAAQSLATAGCALDREGSGVAVRDPWDTQMRIVQG